MLAVRLKRWLLWFRPPQQTPPPPPLAATAQPASTATASTTPGLPRAPDLGLAIGFLFRKLQVLQTKIKGELPDCRIDRDDDGLACSEKGVESSERSTYRVCIGCVEGHVALEANCGVPLKAPVAEQV